MKSKGLRRNFPKAEEVKEIVVCALCPYCREVHVATDFHLSRATRHRGQIFLEFICPQKGSYVRAVYTHPLSALPRDDRLDSAARGESGGEVLLQSQDP